MDQAIEKFEANKESFVDSPDEQKDKSLCKKENLKKFAVNEEESKNLFEDRSCSERKLRSPMHNEYLLATPKDSKNRSNDNSIVETKKPSPKTNQNKAYTSYQDMFIDKNNNDLLDFNKIPSRFDNSKEKLGNENLVKVMPKISSSSG